MGDNVENLEGWFGINVLRVIKEDVYVYDILF